MTHVIPRTLAIGVVALSLTGLAGCSFSASSGSMSLNVSDVESQMNDYYSNLTGTTVVTTCPDEMKGAVGDSWVCSSEDEIGPLGDITVTLKDMDGNITYKMAMP